MGRKSLGKHYVLLCLENLIKFNEILSMDDISDEILSHGHYFIEDNIL
jgi:hypothetical protein